MQQVNLLQPEGCNAVGYHFFVRKLHSFLGVFPISFFLLEHLFTNSLALLNPLLFDSAVNFLQNIPYLGIVEILLIALPLTIHAIYGLYIVYIAKNNTSRYSYARNWMFYLQRISALITLIFVVVHVWHLRITHYSTMSYNTVHNQLTDPFWLSFYVIGLIASLFHFSNGLWNFAVSWGIVVGEKAQDFVWKICMIVFILFTVVGLATIWAFI